MRNFLVSAFLRASAGRRCRSSIALERVAAVTVVSAVAAVITTAAFPLALFLAVLIATIDTAHRLKPCNATDFDANSQVECDCTKSRPLD